MLWFVSADNDSVWQNNISITTISIHQYVQYLGSDIWIKLIKSL